MGAIACGDESTVICNTCPVVHIRELNYQKKTQGSDQEYRSDSSAGGRHRLLARRTWALASQAVEHPGVRNDVPIRQEPINDPSACLRPEPSHQVAVVQQSPDRIGD